MVFTKIQQYKKSFEHKYGIHKKNNVNRRGEIVDSVLGNNITFYWQVELSIQIIYDNNWTEHMEIINGKWEDN